MRLMIGWPVMLWGAMYAFLPAAEAVAAGDASSDVCINEDCLAEGFSSGDGLEEWYLRVLRARASGFKLEDASSSFLQMYATAATFIGEYDEAERYFPVKVVAGDPVGEGYVHAVDARPVVSELIKGRRAVFINESHAAIRTRAAVYSLLGVLKEAGVTYLAIEGLSVKSPREEGYCSDSMILDEGLSLRGYPVIRSGFYIREPVYSEIIREALGLGFHLIAYETMGSSGLVEREQQLAENLACIYGVDESARIAVIAGFAHISKEPNYRVDGGMMAARFKKMTGIEPFTIDTTRLLQLSGDGVVFEGESSVASPRAYALANDRGEFYGSAAYDLMLFLPAGHYRPASGDSWLSLGGRERISVSSEGCANSWPCIIEVFPEVGDIPSDGCVSNGEGCFLFSRGAGRVNYFSGYRDGGWLDIP